MVNSTGLRVYAMSSSLLRWLLLVTSRRIHIHTRARVCVWASRIDLGNGELCDVPLPSRFSYMNELVACAYTCCANLSRCDDGAAPERRISFVSGSEALRPLANLLFSFPSHCNILRKSSFKYLRSVKRGYSENKFYLVKYVRPFE